MQGAPEILFWRRTDVTGLERLKLSISADAVVAESTVICVEDGGFRLDHKWRLTPERTAVGVSMASDVLTSTVRTNRTSRSPLFAIHSRSAGRLPAQERVARSTPASWTGPP